MSHPADILVIDDTVANLRLLRGVLGTAGYRVRVAPNGEFGLAAARSQRPDLILLDLGLPDIDGVEVCARLKGDPELQDVPVLVVSAATQLERKLQAFEAGAADYVTKPFSPEEVLVRIETHLRVRRYQAELESTNERLDRSLMQLSALQAQRDRLVNMLAHDLRSPLMAVRFSLEGLHALPPEAEESIVLARAATQQATNMINDLLHLRRNEEGFEAHRQETSLRRLVTDTVWLLRPTAPGLTLDVQIDEDCPVTLSCDTGLIARVLNNLLASSIRQARTTVRVRVQACPEGHHFEVSDDGEPIPREERDGIFDLYYAGSHRGHGVGLAFCRMAVEAHGGTIQIGPEAPGTAIFFVIPRPAADEGGPRTG
jgi:two-component system sensor histidine kinase/response regulator